MLDFRCLGEVGFVGLVEDLYGFVLSDECRWGSGCRVFCWDGFFVFVVVHSGFGGLGVGSVFFEELCWGDVLDFVGGCVDVGGGVCGCFRFRGVFVSLYVSCFFDGDWWCLVL